MALQALPGGQCFVPVISSGQILQGTSEQALAQVRASDILHSRGTANFKYICKIPRNSQKHVKSCEIC